MTNQPSLDTYTQALDNNDLTFQRGIERESLRVDPNGNLAKTPHPIAFGSKLSHPTITTDFSESQLELITPVSQDLNQTFSTLDNIHRFVASGLSNEILWSASMPCVLQSDPTIPLADYGDSNIGKLKKTYRNGLGNRYGRSMQTICAVHYNFSFPESFWDRLATIEQSENNQDYRNKRYFDLMRNFRRFSWLPIYLFGASPAVCNSFVKGREHGLEPFDDGTLHLPFATSLRSGSLGYQSDAQSESINICYNDINNYVSSLATAVCTPYSDYSKLGTKVDDQYNQLNDCILQSEAEFYSSIRAKRVAPAGANFLQSLKDDGVEYIEVRLMDIDPFHPLGISQETVRFLDTFLLYCLLAESPKHDELLCSEVKSNLSVAVLEGRKPGAKLSKAGEPLELKQWAKQVLSSMTQLAEHLDKTLSSNEHSLSLDAQNTKVDNPESTPSARMLATMKEQSIPFFRFAMNQSLSHHEDRLKAPLTSDVTERFEQMAEESRKKHQEIDNFTDTSFDEYLADILAAYRPLCD